jgi:fructoselysine/glucoselysine PTS system EIIB component
VIGVDAAVISLVRIDDRLIHGQVAYTWSKFLNINCILIANDSIVNDDFKKMSLGLVKPADVNLYIKTIEESIELLNSDKSSKLNILVLVDNSFDALRLARKVSGIKSINVGGIRKKEGKQMISPSVAVDDKDKENFKEMAAAGIEVEIRQVPAEKKKLIKELLKF